MMDAEIRALLDETFRSNRAVLDQAFNIAMAGVPAWTKTTVRDGEVVIELVDPDASPTP
jgi:hypothetical protein